MTIEDLINVAREVSKRYPDNIAFKEFLEQIETIKELRKLMDAIDPPEIDKDRTFDWYKKYSDAYERMKRQQMEQMQREREKQVEKLREEYDKMYPNKSILDEMKKWRW